MKPMNHNSAFIIQPSAFPAVLPPISHYGIARETTGRNYGRIYAYDKYLKILNEGTEP